MKNKLKGLTIKPFFQIILQLLVIIILLPAITNANTKIVNGYIISQHNDTLSRQLQVEADFFGQFNEIKLYHEVTTVDKDGVLQVLTPADIKGFGFSYKDKQYSFISRPIDKERKLLFVEPIITGSKATLYLYKELSYMTNEYHFTLEKQDGSFICLSDFSTLENFKEKLKSFFADDKDAIALIDLSFHSHARIEKDVSKIVQEVNSDKKSSLANRE
jgi:hypothetical protein